MHLTVSYDPAKDAENHVRAIFDAAYTSRGRGDMRERLLPGVRLEAVRAALVEGGERDVVLAKVTDLLAAAPDCAAIESGGVTSLENAWAKFGDQVIFQIEALYGRDWPFESVHVDLTTLSICPYNFKERRIFVHYKDSSPSGLREQLRILSHELNHFMFYTVYAEELSEKLDREKFELLKESVTIFTNPEWSGSPDEEPLRKLYIEKRARTLDEAVRVGVEFLMVKQ